MASTSDVDLSLRQMIGAWRLMCAPAPSSRIETRDGVEYLFSGLAVPFFNVAVLTGERLSTGDVRDAAVRARRWADPMGVPWFFVVTNENLTTPDEAGAAIAEAGLAPALPLTGMHAERVDPPDQVQDDLSMARVQDDVSAEAIIDVNARAYAMDLDAAKAVLGRAAFWHEHIGLLGTVGGRPASSTAVLMVEGLRYVAFVATDPDHQRRGHASRVMRQALASAAAAHTPSPSVLHATDAGRPVYERMGFVTISTHMLYMDASALGGH